MELNTTRVVKRISSQEFKDLVKKYSSCIEISPHALDHLSNAQRKIFDEKYLVNPLLSENPIFIGLQKNGRYAVLYRRKDYFLKIILVEKLKSIEVVTFINTKKAP